MGEAQAATIEIPYEKTTLANGLRVIAHQDVKAPIVTVSVWYHVGSKNERPGKTGLAHLFEHLMFEGSAHHRDEYFRPLEHAGASTINGTTNRDRTNYFETVPSGALDLALWLESDRMGHLLEAISQETLDEQRDVARNEKKQSDNQPYGRVSELLSRRLYAADHPYSWPIIGRIEDLETATLDDVQDWFHTWYGPSNAVVVVSGDVDVDVAIRRVERHFGSFPPGPTLERPGRSVSPLPDSRRQELADRVPQARVYRAWNVPAIYERDYHYLGLLARVLSQGKTSRLYKRLVYDEQIATETSTYLWSGEIGSTFVLQASCAPEIEPRVVEAALDAELERLVQDGIGAAELERAQRRVRSGFIRGIERSGGFGGKSELLAHGEVFRQDPAAYSESLEIIQMARTDDLLSVARSWLGDGSLTLVVRPTGEHSATGTDVDRNALPEAPAVASGRLPFPRSHRLDNGLEILVLERRGLPLVDYRLMVDAGFAADQDSPRGTATLTIAAIDEGTASHSALELSDLAAGLGAHFLSGAGLDHCRLGISSLAETQSEALELLAEVVLEPAFPETEIDRLKKQQVARIRREMATPVQLALRVLPALLYGEDHPYGMPFTGSGSIDDVLATERQHLLDYYRDWIRPQQSVLLCLGDFDGAEAVERVSELFGGWAATEPRGAERPPGAGVPPSRILLLDRPESVQSIVFGGQLVPSRRDPSELALEAFHTALGGAFTSRLNMNLREDKGWTYGAHSLLWNARGERPFLLYASVEVDATAATIREMDREVREMLDRRPITAEEMDKVRRQLTLSLPARRETLGDIAADIEEILACDLPRDYYDSYTERVESLTSEEVTQTASASIDPDRFVWVVVGDVAEIHDAVEDLGFGTPSRMQSDGTLLD